jgi:hypothetical protein
VGLFDISVNCLYELLRFVDVVDAELEFKKTHKVLKWTWSVGNFMQTEL